MSRTATPSRHFPSEMARRDAMVYIRALRRTGDTFASHMDSISGIVTRDVEAL